jgi:hypothetical protein
MVVQAGATWMVIPVLEVELGAVAGEPVQVVLEVTSTTIIKRQVHHPECMI